MIKINFLDFWSLLNYYLNLYQLYAVQVDFADYDAEAHCQNQLDGYFLDQDINILVNHQLTGATGAISLTEETVDYFSFSDVIQYYKCESI